jgi:hypothetical protein
VVRRTFEGKDAIPIDSRKTGESFTQFFAAHAFDGVTPQAIHLSDYAHVEDFLLEIRAIKTLTFRPGK